MDTTYYNHGTSAERWERARMFFDAKEYAAWRASSTAWSRRCRSRWTRNCCWPAPLHSAQLGRAETQLRLLIQRDPVEHYARLMLGRTLQRQGRTDEAEPHIRLASALAGEFESL